MHVLLLFSFVVLGYTRFEADVPLFVWSGEPEYVVSRNQQIRGYYTTEAVADLFKGFWPSAGHHHKSSLLKLVSVAPENQPELVVLLVPSSLSSEEVSLHHGCVPTLAETMKSQHSFYLPFITVSDNDVLHATLKASSSAIKSGANTYFMGSDSFLSKLQKHDIPVNKITSLSEVSPSFTNGKTDLLIIYIEEESTDKRMEVIEQNMKELKEVFGNAGFSKYVAALTGFESSLESTLPSKEEMGLPEASKRAIFVNAPPPSNNGTYPPHIWNGRNTFNVYFNGTFWELFFVLLVFWSIIGFGLSQLLQVQAPDRIADPNAHKKKK